MTDKTVKVGDVVAWDEVPSGAMVKCLFGLHIHYAMRMRDGGSWPAVDSKDWMEFAVSWGWKGMPYGLTSDPVVIALVLTGNETANDLRALAEAFEREHPAT